MNQSSQAGQRHSFLPSRSFFPSRLRTCLDLYSPTVQRAATRQAMADKAPAPFFGRQRTIHQILGGGEVADLLLWRNINLTFSILAGFSFVWYIFAVLECNFVTVLSYFLIFLMLAIFIWSKAGGFIKWAPPDPKNIQVPMPLIISLHKKINALMSTIYSISRGQDLSLLALTVAGLWALSLIGDCCTSLNILFTGFVCMATLPVFYEKFEKQVDEMVGSGIQSLMELGKELGTRVVDKIPRGPEKKSQ